MKYLPLLLLVGCTHTQPKPQRPQPPTGLRVVEVTMMGNPVGTIKNVVEIIPDHEHAVPPCTLIRYVQNGTTNEFHAWLAEVKEIK